MLTVDADAAVCGTIDAYRRGDRDLTALDLYYELERSTALLGFHVMLRAGTQNRDASGLQQSYGDHNRLLMLGLDRLVAGDVDWFCARVDPADPVTDEQLAGMVARVAMLAPSRDDLLALWLGSALHDCGMLYGRGAHVDVEDGVVVGRDVIDTLCPEAQRPLAGFALRHHDYIKDVFLGEVPVSLIASDLDTLDAGDRPLALTALGMVQVTGAASLGGGRLGGFRLAVFDRCFDGDALADAGAGARAARLLARSPEDLVAGVDARVAGGALDHPALATAAAHELLAVTPVHGWHRALQSAAGAPVDTDDRAALLAAVAARVADTGPAGSASADGRVDAVVLEVADADAPGRIETTLSGRRLLVLG